MGTVVISKHCVCLARKHRFFRYVQAWSWGRWNHIREEYPQIPRSFEQNASDQTRLALARSVLLGARSVTVRVVVCNAWFGGMVLFRKLVRFIRVGSIFYTG